MQGNAADHLHIEVPHLQDPLAGLTHNGKGFRQHVVQRFASSKALLELGRLGLQFGIRQFRYFRFVGINDANRGRILAKQSFVTAAENSFE